MASEEEGGRRRNIDRIRIGGEVGEGEGEGGRKGSKRRKSGKIGRRLEEKRRRIG